MTALLQLKLIANLQEFSVQPVRLLLQQFDASSQSKVFGLEIFFDRFSVFDLLFQTYDNTFLLRDD
jgi:hypothetical protein